MRIRDLFNEKKLVFSFEVFPPKNTSPIKSIYNALNELSELNSDFISVTYGAGGTSVNNKTTEISSLIKNVYKIEALAHLTSIGAKKENINFIKERLALEGVENILALRGDKKEECNSGDFLYASNLMNHLREDFNIIGACYPEGHIENKSIDLEIDNMKRKEENGCSSFISQLFFSNETYYEFLEKSRNNGVKAPIQAGIMPVINKKQIQRIENLCGAYIPLKFKKIMNRYEHNPEALREAGIAYAVEQIIDLSSSSVDGIHLYTMNNPYVARKIKENIKTVLKAVNE